MRKIYSLALALFVCMASFAQITKVTYGGNEYEVAATQSLTVGAPAATSYHGGTADFSTQLKAMLEAVGLEAATADNFVQVDLNGAGYAYNTNDGWHGADATIDGKGWGNAGGVCVKPWNGDTNAIDGTISYIGCYDETWEVGQTHTCYFAAINEGKAALLDVNLKFFDTSKVVYGENTYEIVATSTLTVEELAKTAYSGNTANFSTQLAEMLKAVGLESATTDNFIQVDACNNGYAYNTNDGWHSADGMIDGQGWGHAGGVCVKPWNGETNAIDGTISYIGCYDETWQVGDSHSCAYAVINDGKAAMLAVTINFISAAPMEEPVLFLSQLEVVKEVSASLALKAGKQYEGAKVTVASSADICAALGCDEDALSANIEKVFLTQQVLVGQDDKVNFTDTLLVSRFGTDGWFGRYSDYNEETAEETVLTQNGPMTHGGGCTFYIQNPKITDGEFTVTYGQYPGTLAAGDVDYAVLYLVNGTKAVKITLTVDVQEQETIDFSQMTKVGEQTGLAGKLEVANAYTSVTVAFDGAAVLSALGCTEDDLMHYNFADEEYNSIVEAANNDYWQSEQGFSQAWSTSPCCQVTLDLANGEATLLQMAGKYVDITEAQTFPLHYILANGANYYQLDFEFTLKPVGQIEGELVEVSRESIKKQIIPADSYDVEGRYQIDMDYVESLIGTKEFTLYGDKWNADESKFEITKNYTCNDTANKGFGFWYGSDTYENEEGQVLVSNDGWGCASTNSFGFQIFTTGEIMFFQFPGQRSAGDAYDANMYLVNEETGKYVTYTMHISYVDSIMPEGESVACDTIDIVVNSADFFGNPVPVDMSLCYETLGLDAETIGDAGLLVYKSLTTTTSASFGESITMTTKGYVADEDKADFSVEILAEDGVSLNIDPWDLDFSEGSGTQATVRFAIELDGKIVDYIVNFNAPESEDDPNILTKAEELDGKTVYIINESTHEYLYGKDAQNTAVGSKEEATAETNVVTSYKIEKVDNGYMFRCVTPAGGDYALWGNSVCYLNSQPDAGGVTFNLGLAERNGQDIENGAVWNLTYDDENAAWTIQCVANDAYLAGTTVSKELTAQWILYVADSATSISSVAATVAKTGKFIDNGTIVIVRNGVKYNVAGVVIK